jgi:hypothetical protein
MSEISRFQGRLLEAYIVHRVLKDKPKLTEDRPSLKGILEKTVRKYVGWFYESTGRGRGQDTIDRKPTKEVKGHLQSTFTEIEKRYGRIFKTFEEEHDYLADCLFQTKIRDGRQNFAWKDYIKIGPEKREKAERKYTKDSERDQMLLRMENELILDTLGRTTKYAVEATLGKIAEDQSAYQAFAAPHVRIATLLYKAMRSAREFNQNIHWEQYEKEKADLIKATARTAINPKRDQLLREMEAKVIAYRREQSKPVTTTTNIPIRHPPAEQLTLLRPRYNTQDQG